MLLGQPHPGDAALLPTSGAPNPGQPLLSRPSQPTHPPALCSKPALEALACAARLQSRSAHAASGSPPQPGHLSLASSGSFSLQVNHAGDSCLASLGLDGDCPSEIREHVTDEHLLQFAVVAGEAVAAAAAAELALPPAWAHAGCLLRAAGAAHACGDEAWELVVSRSEGGLSYEVRGLCFSCTGVPVVCGQQASLRLCVSSKQAWCPEPRPTARRHRRHPPPPPPPAPGPRRAGVAPAAAQRAAHVPHPRAL